MQLREENCAVTGRQWSIFWRLTRMEDLSNFVSKVNYKDFPKDIDQDFAVV